MNVLLLDNTDEALFNTLKDHEDTKVVTGTIQRPRLFPIPDIIIVNFDSIFGSETKETILIELSRKLHPHVMIIAVSKQWDDGLKMFANLFGVDECCDIHDLNIIRTIINIFVASDKL